MCYTKLEEYLRTHPILNCTSLLPESKGSTKTTSTEELKQIISDCFAKIQNEDPCDHFHQIYKPVASFAFRNPDQKALLLGDEGKDRNCAICEKSEPEVSFSSEAHLLPQLTGRRELISLEECDECNARMGREYEPHLASLLMDNRAINCMKSSSTGTVKLQPKGSKCYIGGQACGENLEIVLVEGDDGIRLEEWGANTIKLVYTRPGYYPQKASKSIAKSVYLSIPKKDRNSYKQLREWIDNKSIIAETTIVHMFIMGPALSITAFAVWSVRDEESEYSPLVAMLALGNVIILWSYPNFDANKYKTLYPHVPKPMYQGLELKAQQITSFDMTRMSEVENSIYFHYDTAVLSHELFSANSKISVESDSEKYKFSADCTLTPKSDRVTRIDLSNGDCQASIYFPTSDK